MPRAKILLFASLGATAIALGLAWLLKDRATPESARVGDPRSSIPSKGELLMPAAGTAREGPAEVSASGETIYYSIARESEKRPNARTISGRLVLPDGTPARSRVLVFAQGLDPSRRRSRTPVGEGASCDAQGRFVTGELEDGLYTLEASGYRSAGLSFLDVTWRGSFAIETPEDRAIADMTMPQVLALPQPALGRAGLRSVRPGTAGIVLTLEPGLIVRGVVRDDLGAPVDDFLAVACSGRIERRLEAISDFVGLAGDGLAQRFEASGGRFECSGFSDGLWTLLIWAAGFGVAAPQEITLPSSGELEFVLPRGGRVKGVVVDPNGKGVPAELVLQQVPAIGSYDGADWQEEGIPTSPDGSFSLSAIHGTLHLYARSDLGAPSRVVVLPIEPGDVLSNVRLELQIGGRIEVELLDEEGRPLAGGEVWTVGFGIHKGVVTDEQGLASFDGLAGGDHSVSFADEWDAEGWRSCRTEVRLAEGESRRVVLRIPKTQPVQLSGRVTAGTEPIAHAFLQFSSESFGHEQARTNEDGSYSVRLPAPGTYEVDIDDPVRGSEPGLVHLVTIGQVQIEVPAFAACSHDISLDVGSISGRVRGPGGTSLSAVPIRAVPEDAAARFASSVETDSNGAYELRVPSGTYTIVAGDRDFFDNPPEELASLAAASVRGVAVGPNETVAGIDFDLVTGGTVEGSVRRNDGTPVDSVFVAIRVEETHFRGLADACGRFRIRGVLPGRASVSAKGSGFAGENLVSSEELSIDVEAGRTQSIALVLIHATEVELRAIDAGGSPVEARLEILPQEGTGRTFPLHPRGTSSLAWLPDGTYTARAGLAAKTTEAAFEVAGENKKLVEIPID